jgi:hypothetical protein
MYQKVTAASVNAWWKPHSLHQFNNQSLGLYAPGDYPVPFWKYGPPNCGLTPRRGRRTLGDDPTAGYDPSLWVSSGAGAGQPAPTAIGIPAGTVPGAPVDTAGAQIAALFANAPVPLPGVSAATLLQAASLPNAPAVVKQAAAQYTAANPASTFLSGSAIAGIPNYLLLGGAGLLLVVMMSSKRR